LSFQEYASDFVALSGEPLVQEAVEAAGTHEWVVTIGDEGEPIAVLTSQELAGLSPTETLRREISTHGLPPLIVMAADAATTNPEIPEILASLKGQVPRFALWHQGAVTGVLDFGRLTAALAGGTDTSTKFEWGAPLPSLCSQARRP
jgi:hypothetical protein